MTPKIILLQAVMWDRFAKAFPFILLAVSGLLYSVGFREWELLVDTLLIVLLIAFSIWWFWVVWTIMIIASILEKSKVNLRDLIDEIRSLREDFKKLK